MQHTQHSMHHTHHMNYLHPSDCDLNLTLKELRRDSHSSVSDLEVISFDFLIIYSMRYIYLIK